MHELPPRNCDLSNPKYLKGLRDPDLLLYSPLIALKTTLGKHFAGQTVGRIRWALFCNSGTTG